MKVFFVGAGPGAVDLLTVRAMEMIKTCRFCIYAGSLVSPDVISLIPEDAEAYDSAELDLEELVALYKNAKARDVDVVRLHTGDPSIYGAIAEQMDELDRLGIAYEITPGVSAFQAAAAAVQAQLTAPEVSQTITLTRAKGRTPVPPEQDLTELARTRATLCLFLSVQKLYEVVADLAPHYGEDCPAAVVYHASWPDEQILQGTLMDIADQVKQAGISKTAMVLVGRALARQGGKSKLYDPGFSHEYREGKSE